MTEEQPFNEAVDTIGRFFNFSETQLANSVYGIDAGTVARWRLSLEKLDQVSPPKVTRFRYDQYLLDRRLLITKVNEYLSNMDVIPLFDQSWPPGTKDQPTLKQIAARLGGLHTVAVELENYLTPKPNSATKE